MTTATIFLTSLHRQIAELTSDLFSTASNVDTVLLVNSCARGQAIPESDIDFAILVKSGTTAIEIEDLEKRLNKKIIIQPSESFHLEKYEVQAIDTPKNSIESNSIL